MRILLLFLCLSTGYCCLQKEPGLTLVADYLQMRSPWCLSTEWRTQSMQSKVNTLKQAFLEETHVRHTKDDLSENLQNGHVVVHLNSEEAFTTLMNTSDSLNASTLFPILLVLPKNVTDTDIMVLDASKHITINHKLFFYDKMNKVVSEGYWINKVLVLKNLAFLEDPPLALQVSTYIYFCFAILPGLNS